MGANITSLYVDDASIRLMVTRGKRIIKLADVPLDTELTEISTREKEEQLAQKIKFLFKSNKISARKIILGLSGLHCLTRPIALPELPRAMLEEAVTREASRVLPVPVEQLYISWQTVSLAQGKLMAFMVAIPRPIADTLLKVLNEAGFKPYLMDIKPLALARLSREANAIILDVQSREFDIVVMVDGLPQPIRTVPFPEEPLSYPERLKIVKDELMRTIQFYNSNNQEKPIKPDMPLLVSGEVAEEPDQYDTLSQELGLKVSPLTSPLKCLKQLDPSHHLVNVGLTLKEFIKDAGPMLANFNALPAPYLPKQISLNKLLAVPATAVAIGLIVMLGMTVREAGASLDKVETELNSNKLLLEKRQALKKDLTQSITGLEKKVAAASTARTGYNVVLNDINRIGDKVNGDLRATMDQRVTEQVITALSYTKAAVVISGEAKTEQEVMDYVRRLTNTGRFKEITITSLSRSVNTDDDGTDDTMKYTLSVQFFKEEKK